MLYMKIQSKSFLDSGEEDHFVFLLYIENYLVRLFYMGMLAILFNGEEQFEQYPFDRRFHVKSGKNW